MLLLRGCLLRVIPSIINTNYQMKKGYIVLFLLSILISCSKEEPKSEVIPDKVYDKSSFVKRSWDGEKRADISYEIFVRSFADSNGDGIGDLKGIEGKLDYLNSLGVKLIWLTPIHKSSSYHGYDVEDYKSVNPDFGSIQDFENMVAKAHSVGIKVVLDMVINHTSKFHPWFIEAKTGNNEYEGLYLIYPSSGLSDRIAQGGVPMTNAYYSNQWHSFDRDGVQYSYMGMFSDWMPEINYGPLSTSESSNSFIKMKDIASFWIDKGVDGFRLDAVKHIYQNETSDENPQFLKKYHDALKSIKPDIYLVGENLSGDYNSVAPYYKGLPAMFNFDAWYKLIYAINNAHAKWYPKDINDMESKFKTFRSDAVNATKLSNHDEDRTRSVLGGDIAKSKVAAAILLTISGSPYLYYGEEIGMVGFKDNDDRNVREPFLWSPISNDNIRTKWHTPRYSTDQNVEPLSVQQGKSESIYNVYKQFCELRNTYPSLAYGDMILPDNFDVYSKNFMAFERRYGNERLFIIHNVSPYQSGYSYKGKIVRGVASLGDVSYKSTGEDSYLITLPPYSTIILEL